MQGQSRHSRYPALFEFDNTNQARPLDESNTIENSVKGNGLTQKYKRLKLFLCNMDLQSLRIQYLQSLEPTAKSS